MRDEASDPARTIDESSGPAGLLREYRSRTTAHVQDGASAWRALSNRLDASLPTAALMSAMIVALGLWLLVRDQPSVSRLGTGVGGSEGASGAAGSGGSPGADDV